MKITRISVLIFLLMLAGCTQEQKTPPDTSEEETVKPIIIKNPDHFFFVGMNRGVPGVYKYVFADSSFKLFWSNPKEKVVELSTEPESKYSYFLTASTYGRKGIMPFVEKVKLYLIEDMKDGKHEAKLIKEIGNGLQVFSHWDEGKTVRITINKIDKKIASYVEQHTQIFNIEGKQLVDEKKIYDISKEGYPLPEGRESQTHSPYSNHFISIEDSALFIHAPGIDRSIMNTNLELSSVGWTKDRKYVVTSLFRFIPADISTSGTGISNIVIYSIPDNKVIKIWDGSGIKNFIISGTRLIFDDGYGSDSYINVFDMEKLFDIKINVKGGCGIRNIPELPEFGA